MDKPHVERRSAEESGTSAEPDSHNKKAPTGILWSRNEKEGLEDLFVTGKVDGRRDRGRQRMTYLSSLAGWTGIPELELMRAAKDRARWRIMVANVCSRHGT
jgi:hypothetical protein